jgi:flagellar biosynthesis protein FlhA
VAKKKTAILGQLTPILEVIVRSRDLSIVVFVMAILAIIIVPLPSGLLDFMLTISISIAVLIILISLYIPKPTDLTTFPTLILIITLFRLSVISSPVLAILSSAETMSSVSSSSLSWY